jgi:PAS domain S-box-containing protein
MPLVMAAGGKNMLDALRARNAAIANLGRYAVSGAGLTAVFDEACSTLARVLEADLVSLVEEQPHAFVLRAGHGFSSELIDRSIAPLGTSLAGFTLDCGEPVVLIHVDEEERFQVSEGLRALGVVSGVTVPIRGPNRPFGVLSVLSRAQRRFTESDVVVVRLVANMLAGAAEADRARSTIREREVVLTELVEHGPDILVRFDRNLRHLYASPAVERATGFPAERFIGKTNEELGMPVELCELWRRELEPVFTSGEPRRFDFSFTGPEGMRFFESHAVAERGPSGSRDSVVVYTRDRTEARLAELERLASEARYRELFDRALDMIVLFDTEGRIVDVNRATERTLGYARGELVGRSHDLLIPADGVRDAERRLERKLNGSEPTSAYEATVVCKDGRRIPIHASTQVLIRGGKPAGVLAISRDISEQMVAREQAAASERRFRGAFDDAATGMMLVEPDGTILRVNAAFARMLQYSPVELAGTKIFAFMSSDDTEASRASIEAIARAERDSFRVEKSYIRRDGSSLAAHVAVSGIRASDGSLQYFVAHIQDLSELRRVQNELDETGEQLRQSQKLEAIGKLAGGVAHDFNNLLTAINGYSDLALAALERPEHARKSIEEIRRAGERAAELTQQLLTFSRQQVLEPEVIDVNHVVTGYLTMLRRLVGEDVVIDASLAETLPMVHADPGQLGQVLLNLVVNARDAMPNGGRLDIATGTAQVADGVRVTLRVGDTGHGMGRETMQQIFEPFFTTKEQGKGTGLGLSTVHGIVEQSGGTVEVDSAPGEGTTFTVSLPTTTAVPKAPCPPDAEPVSGNGELVLVVEDDAAVRGLVEEMLVAAGYAVVAAATPGEAIAIAESDQAIDAVVTDVVMPEMNGHQLAQRLHVLRPGVPVLYTSGYAGDIIQTRGLVEAGDAFIRKPYSSALLVGKLQALLDARSVVA